MNIRTTFYSIALFASGISSQQVIGQEMPKVIPPSPETATILQHSPVNVSLYTGTPNISVPFHTISYEGVEVPISLSYNADGVRVDNIASWAGLGWSLNAGGLISRTINKLPDDAPFAGYMNTAFTMEDFLARGGGPAHPSTWVGNLDFGGPEEQSWQLSPDAAGNFRDYEPDMFNFSFLGYSGQFYYNQQEGNFNQAPLSNLKIETKKEAGIIAGFIVTDEAGVKYYFGSSKNGNTTAREHLKDARTKTITDQGIMAPSNPSFPLEHLFCYQAWMLIDIVLPNSSQTINFIYSTEYNVKTYMLTAQDYIKGNGCIDTNTHYLLREFNQPKLETILFPTGKIVFEKESVFRQDLDKSYALKGISLFDKKDNQIKKMQMNSSYWESTLGNNNSVLFDQGASIRGKYRLRLDSISLFGNNNTEEEGRYKFDYNPIALPNRFSKATDYFGYYNGSNLNNSFLPKIFFAVPVGNVGTANRSIDPAFTMASVLQRVTYPTGGYDEFDWGNNSISFFGGNGQSYKDHTNTIIEEFNSFLPQYYVGLTSPKIDFEKTITIPETIVGPVDFSLTMSGCNAPYNNLLCDFFLRIEGVTNPNYQTQIFQQNFILFLQPGVYKLIANARLPWVNQNTQAEPGGPLDPNQQGGSTPRQFALKLTWSDDPTPGEMLYGGLRINGIRSYDKLESLAFSKSYVYGSFINSNSTSSGRTVNIIDVLDTTFRTNCQGNSNSVTNGYKLSSNSLAPLVYTKGSLVGYEYVTEKFNNGANGYNQYTYSFVDQYLDAVVGPAPYGNTTIIPVTHMNQVYCDWLRGELIKQETFDRLHNRLSTKIYDYESDNQKPIQFAGIQIVQFPHVGIGIGVAYNSAVTEYRRLKKLTKTNFLDGSPVTVFKEYFYNSLSQVSQERTFDNYQLDTSTHYYYPSDAIMDTKPYAVELKGQNRIGIPLETKVTDASGGELSLLETVFNDWDTTSALHLAPSIIKTSKRGVAHLEPRVKYNALDLTTGKPLEVEQADGTKISYIWGYGGTQPVAKIENMAYASIPFNRITDIQSFSIYVLGNNYNEALLIQKLDALRMDPALANAMVTTYTYKPLVGISTITDPKGDKISYHYDSFSRLKEVRDKDNNILSENQYNYRP
jgi:YD repeat-containing protein